MKKLYRSEDDRQLAGVCGGFGEFFGIDPTLVRVGYLFITIITGIIPGVLAYPLLAIIMPTKSEVKNGKKIN